MLLALLRDFSESKGGVWQFQSAPNDLQGRFDLQAYYACGPQTNCGEEIGIPATGGAGAYLDLHYYPGLGDPIPDPTGITKNVQWIQRVSSNHSLNPDQHNLAENVLDINIGQSTPYYSGVAGNGVSVGIPPTYRYFADRPYRADILNDHFWNAELYLVEETTPPGSPIRTAQIYNGIKWGWRNQTFFKPVCNSSGECSTPPSNPPVYIIPDECHFEIHDYCSANALTLMQDETNVHGETQHINEPPKSVPEPSSTLGLLTLGAWGGIAYFKNHKKRKSSGSAVSRN